MLSSFVVLLTVFGMGLNARAADKPNILLICVDDLKPSLGAYGDNIAKSPSIDRLAARGMRFHRAYCNQAVCAPSRNSLLTGLRPQTLGIYDLVTSFRKAVPDAVTLPQYFKLHGYRCESLGKILHVGYGNPDDAASWSMPHWGDYQPEPFYLHAGNRAPKRGAAYESADVPDSAYPDGQLADEAVRRLQKAARTPQEPFFLAVGFFKPHLPFCAPKKYWDLYDRSAFDLPERRVPPQGAPPIAATNWDELRMYAGIPEVGELSDELQRTLIHGYYAAVSYMDAQVGRVIDALDDTGLSTNTVVVFWSDHGWHLGDHGMWCKHTNYEQATRVPLIVVAPWLASAGKVTHALVESVDIYPSLCDVAGLPAPQGLDGASFADALGDASAATKQAVFHVYPRDNMIGCAVRTARYRLVQWKSPDSNAETELIELYDYDTDPDETRNLAIEQPSVVAEIRGILESQPKPRRQLH